MLTIGAGARIPRYQCLRYQSGSLEQACRAGGRAMERLSPGDDQDHVPKMAQQLEGKFIALTPPSTPEHPLYPLGPAITPSHLLHLSAPKFPSPLHRSDPLHTGQIPCTPVISRPHPPYPIQTCHTLSTAAIPNPQLPYSLHTRHAPSAPPVSPRIASPSFASAYL